MAMVMVFAVEVGDGEADAFDGYGPFGDHPLADVFGDADFEGPVGGLLVEVGLVDWEITGSRAVSCRSAVDVALDDVAAEGAAGGGGQFEIDLGAGGERAEGGAVEGFLGQVGVEERGVDVERGEANAGDAERIAFAETAGEAGSFDRDAADAAAFR
jgi:hypothetical protein